MINLSPSLQSAARHLAALLNTIATRATSLLHAAPLNPRAATHIARALELCALLIARLATNPAYAPAPRAENDEDPRPPASTQANAPENPEPGERPESPERSERPDTTIPGANLSTPALVAELHRQLRLAAEALGHPLPKDLLTLCHQAAAAARHIELIGLPNLLAATLHHPTPSTPRAPPKPRPATTLDL